MDRQRSGDNDDADKESDSYARLSRNELVSQLEGQARDLHEQRRIIMPFKVENVRLSRGLKRTRQQIQEVLKSLREFFADPARREWFKQRKDDVPLCTFFQRLIAWYRAVGEDDCPTIGFYQGVWESGSYSEGASGKDASSPEASEPPSTPMSSDVGGGSSSTRPSSHTLYDACRARTGNLRLQEENARLRQENASLHRANEMLRRELSKTGGDEAGPSKQAGAKAGGSSRQAQLVRRPVRTLSTLACQDRRWERLLRDPDKLFSADDVVDETYEQYLSDVLKQMEKNNCSFKRAIELLDSDAQESRDAKGAGSGGDIGNI